MAMAQLQGLSLKVGLIVGLFDMLGDVLSSFIKRRMGLPSSSMALGLDQILESLIPLLAVREIFGLTWISILQLVAGFFFLELLLSQLLYRINIRRRPY
jgi:CDP-2,3-bis-(O-geranylgeranyl)-sn-glycerol synthase